MNRYHQLSEEKRNFSINFDQSRESAIIIRPPHVGINIPDDDPDTTERNAMTLLHRYTRLCFFLAGQWFWPAENFIKRHNLPRKVCRIAYAIWQGIVVLIMWSYFLYSMRSFPPQTIEEVDWLCPLTDIKNMAHGLCWIVNQHTGLVFFLFGNFERLLKQLSITKEEVSFPERGTGGRKETGKKSKRIARGLFLGNRKLRFTRYFNLFREIVMCNRPA